MPPGRVEEEGLENLAAQFGGNARPVVGQFADHGVAHVAGARGDADAAFLFLAMLPGVANEVPGNLVQMSAIENDREVVGNLHQHAAGRHVFGLDDFVGQRAQEFGERDDLRLLAVAPVELQHFADDPVDPLCVVADHREQALALGHDGAVLLEQLGRLVDCGQRIAHLVRDRGRQPAHRRQFHLLGFGLRAPQVLEIDQRAAVQARPDAHQPDAQQALRRVHLERLQRLAEILLPAPPVIVEGDAEFGEPHAPAHPSEAAQQARDLGIVSAYDAVQIDHQHAVLHVLDDEPVHLLEVGHVDAALRGQVLRLFRVAAERDGDADRREISEPDDPGLE